MDSVSQDSDAVVALSSVVLLLLAYGYDVFARPCVTVVDCDGLLPAVSPVFPNARENVLASGIGFVGPGYLIVAMRLIEMRTSSNQDVRKMLVAADQ